MNNPTPDTQNSSVNMQNNNGNNPNVDNVAQPQGFPVMATFWERFVAVLIDVFVLYTFSIFFTVPFQFMMGFVSDSNTFTLSFVYNSLIQMVLASVYYIYFYTHKGQSLGKRAMKLKVVKSDDLKYLTPGGVLLREILGKLVSSSALYLGYLWYFMSEKRQTWHDMIASTYVVKTDAKGNLLMNGPQEYEKKPLFTFLPCGCTVFFLLAILMLGMLAAVNVQDSLERAREASGYKEENLNGANQVDYGNPASENIINLNNN